jgi:hypothetical protein
LKAAGIFIVKCLVFSIIFWSLWYVAFRPGSGNPSGSQQNDSAALMKKYWEQVAQSEKLQGTYLEQQRRATIQLEKQDELLSRWEKVIQKWEKTGSQR